MFLDINQMLVNTLFMSQQPETEIDRMDARLQELALSTAEFARRVGESPQNINNWRKRGKIAGNKRHVVAQELGVATDWLINGSGPRHPGADGGNLIATFHPEDPASEGEVRIPESRVRFSGGHGHSLAYEAIDDSEPATYRLSWFQKERINPKKARRFRVTGNSMEPMLFPGDSILVNLEETTVREGLIYVFRHGNELKVKKLIPKADGSLVLRSINRDDYPDDTVPAEVVADQITIIGRVRDKSGRGGL
jgi:phage repressor protein C with HTH and peptisase S24 domain